MAAREKLMSFLKERKIKAIDSVFTNSVGHASLGTLHLKSIPQRRLKVSPKARVQY